MFRLLFATIFLAVFNHLFITHGITFFLLSFLVFFFVSLLLFEVSLSLFNNCLHVAFVSIGSIYACLYERVGGLASLNLSVQGHMRRCKVCDLCLILHDLSHARELVFLEELEAFFFSINELFLIFVDWKSRFFGR